MSLFAVQQQADDDTSLVIEATVAGDRRLDDEWAAVLRGPLHGEESHHAKGFGSTRT